jgi:hypothetical protein
MHSIWTVSDEAAILVLEILFGESRPPGMPTLFALFIVMMAYSARRTTTSQQLIVLRILESTTLVVWTVCLLALHHAGLT